MVITDFDGILTDNCVYVDEDGKMSRRINFKDVMGLSILYKNGYKIAIISGEKNKAIDILAEKFEIETYQGIRNKLEIVEQIVKNHGLSDEEWVYIGDDINDKDSLCRAKYAVTVPGAVKKIKEIPNIQITETPSGEGALREIADELVN
jgi:YrbI family 3-deoxy-D-manno-octulosonate 8-phosphate phosphatase